jgi:hypothetical protein
MAIKPTSAMKRAIDMYQMVDFRIMLTD